MNKEEVKVLANNLMFEVDDNEADDIVSDFELLEKMLNFF